MLNVVPRPSADIVPRAFSSLCFLCPLCPLSPLSPLSLLSSPSALHPFLRQPTRSDFFPVYLRRGSHRSLSDSDSTRCYAPSSNDGAQHLDANSPMKAQAPYAPSPSNKVSPVTVSSEPAHHSPNYYGYHHQGHGPFPAALPTTASNPYATGQTPRGEPHPHPPGSPQMPPPPGSNYHPNTADRSSSGGGGGQTVGVNADESLARATECAMFIGDRKNAPVGGGAQGGVRY